jgi:carbonic anhydrase
LTGTRGRYAFLVRANGPYVVRGVTPKRWTQTSPTFVYTAPAGSYTDDYSASSWIYNTGNTDPNNGAVGVSGWSNVAPAGNLPFESPIDITVPPINLSRYLSVKVSQTVAQVAIRENHDIVVTFSDPNQTINLGGTTFTLDQLHFHDPSEDRLGGKRYPMEEHLVFQSAAGALAVVSAFLQLGAPNAALQPILDAVSSGAASASSSPGTSLPVNLTGLRPSSLQGWFYQGSLTVPPLKQAINWLVLSTPITLSFTQLEQYEIVAKANGFPTNARPIQPLDGRQVNQCNFDVNFQGQSVSGLNFGLKRNY